MTAWKRSAPRAAAARASAGARSGLSALRRVLMALLLLAATPLAVPSAGSVAKAQAEADAVETRIERMKASGRYQMELPTPEPPPPRPPRSSNPIELSDLGQAALIIVVVAAVLYILASLANRRAPPRKGAVPAKAAATRTGGPAPEAPSEAALADAESRATAAAREGRYAEAIHILLLGAIGHLRERDARSTARSLTSREILDRVFGRDGSPEGRRALAALVAAVEISRFGGRAADFEGFTRCFEAYKALRAAVAQHGFTPRVPAAAA